MEKRRKSDEAIKSKGSATKKNRQGTFSFLYCLSQQWRSPTNLKYIYKRRKRNQRLERKIYGRRVGGRRGGKEKDIKTTRDSDTWPSGRALSRCTNKQSYAKTEILKIIWFSKLDKAHFFFLFNGLCSWLGSLEKNIYIVDKIRNFLLWFASVYGFIRDEKRLFFFFFLVLSAVFFLRVWQSYLLASSIMIDFLVHHCVYRPIN